uniref:Uncharacterized protein n=1 Tax=Arundo donax TaxID=35708 RepID=A0A0A8XYT9_ARUDO
MRGAQPKKHGPPVGPSSSSSSRSNEHLSNDPLGTRAPGSRSVPVQNVTLAAWGPAHCPLSHQRRRRRPQDGGEETAHPSLSHTSRRSPPHAVSPG